jgi:hypothetical protein
MLRQRINHHAKADRIFQQGGDIAKLNPLLGVMGDGTNEGFDRQTKKS